MNLVEFAEQVRGLTLLDWQRKYLLDVEESRRTGTPMRPWLRGRKQGWSTVRKVMDEYDKLT